MSHPSRTTSQGGNAGTDNPSTAPHRQGSRFVSPVIEEQPRSSPTPVDTTPTTEHLIPVVIVGLRSLSRDLNSRSPPSPSPRASSENARNPGSPAAGVSGLDNPVQPMPADEIDAITSSYVIIVLGGHYPPEHRYASATGSDDSNDLDQLWYEEKCSCLSSLIPCTGTWWS